MAAKDGGCPKWGDLELDNGRASYSNIPMAVKKSGPPGISGVATMALGLGERPITVTGIMVGTVDKSLAEKQIEHEAACQFLTLKKFTTGNGRVFPSVRYVTVTWEDPIANAVTGFCDARYTSIFIQTVPGSEEVAA